MMNSSILPGPSGTKSVVLLVDDQAIIAEAVRRMFVGEEDIRFHYCNDPTKALEMAREVKPTVILQDLVMPEIDGLTLVRYFRASAATRDIPLIVLSVKEDPKIKADSFASGANDYVVKLPDRLELLARVRYHSKGYIALQQRNLAYQRLAKELAEAAEYVTSLLPAPLEGRPATSWRYIPSAQLGGDILGHHWIDDDHFAIYLLDVCGHGVGAALLSVTALNVLSSQSIRGTDFRDPAQVLRGLNDAFQMEKHNNMFFTIWYGVYCPSEKVLTYASGGHPPAVLLTGPSADRAVTTKLTTSGFMIGGMPDVTYKSDHVAIDAFATLFVYSDGAYEIKRQDQGRMWTLDEWITLLADFGLSGSKDLDQVVRQVQSLAGTNQLDDDFTLLQIWL